MESVDWLPPTIVQAAGLPDDELWRQAATQLAAWWAPSASVTAPDSKPVATPEDFWVAVHAFAGGAESVFTHAAAASLMEAAPRALRSARRALAIANVEAEYITVFLGQRKIILDETSLPYSDWHDPVSLGRAGFLCSDGRSLTEVISPIHVLQKNELRFRPQFGLSGQPPEWHIYIGRQFLIKVADVPTGVPIVTELLRGQPFISESMITRREVESMAHEAAGWLLRNVGPDGHLPSVVATAQGGPAATAHVGNELQEWIATRTLVEAARREKSVTALAAARRNVQLNLSRFYHDEDDYGVIEMSGQVQLGAAGIAALTLKEFPDAPPEWNAKEQRLERLVSFLWRNNGSFRTFLRPSARSLENDHLYSGEAMLYWASLLAESAESSLLKRYRRSAEYYRDWQRKNRDPSLVPWHTMATVVAWPLTSETPGAEWVFEMNDWLLSFQQAEGAPSHPDTAGRFYDPEQAINTADVPVSGLYLEGLSAALRLARITGDITRGKSYALGIRRGLRMARQLQFAGAADFLGLPAALRLTARGGFRTTQYDSTIRCENVQHILRACWSALAFPDDAGLFAVSP